MPLHGGMHTTPRKQMFPTVQLEQDVPEPQLSTVPAQGVAWGIVVSTRAEVVAGNVVITPELEGM